MTKEVLEMIKEKVEERNYTIETRKNEERILNKLYLKAWSLILKQYSDPLNNKSICTIDLKTLETTFILDEYLYKLSEMLIKDGFKRYAEYQYGLIIAKKDIEEYATKSNEKNKPKTLAISVPEVPINMIDTYKLINKKIK